MTAILFLCNADLYSGYGNLTRVKTGEICQVCRPLQEMQAYSRVSTKRAGLLQLWNTMWPTDVN